LAEYRDLSAEIRALGADLVALSVDPPATSAALRAELALPFSLLGDVRREVVARWGLLNAEEKGGIAYPAVFVLARGGVVRYRSLDRLRSRVSPEGVIAFLRAGLASTAPAEPARTTVWPALRDYLRVARNAARFGIRSPRPDNASQEATMIDEKVSATVRTAGPAADYALQVPAHVRHGLTLGLLLGVAGLLVSLLGRGHAPLLAIGLLTIGALAVAFLLVIALVVGRGLREKARDTILAAFPWRGDEAVLDVGCGNGFLLVGAARRLTTGKATGIDLWKADAGGQRAEAVLRNAGLEGVASRVALTNGDARRMPFPDGAFDLVMSSLMLHHVGSRSDREQVMAEMMRVTRPGGQVLLYDMLPFVRAAASQLRAHGFVEVKRLAGLALVVLTATRPR